MKHFLVRRYSTQVSQKINPYFITSGLYVPGNQVTNIFHISSITILTVGKNVE